MRSRRSLALWACAPGPGGAGCRPGTVPRPRSRRPRARSPTGPACSVRTPASGWPGSSTQVRERTGAEIAVLVVPSTAPDSIEDYSIAVFDRWKIGQQGKDNGLLFLVAVQDRRMRITTGYGLEGILPDGKVGEIRDRAIIPLFRAGRYADGIVRGTEALAAAILGQAGGARRTGGASQTSAARGPGRGSMDRRPAGGLRPADPRSLLPSRRRTDVPPRAAAGSAGGEPAGCLGDRRTAWAAATGRGRVAGTAAGPAADSAGGFGGGGFGGFGGGGSGGGGSGRIVVGSTGRAHG